MSDLRAALPCGYVFPLTGGPCRAGPDHKVHRENHDYEPKERRSGRDRRATLAVSATDEGPDPWFVEAKYSSTDEEPWKEDALRYAQNADYWRDQGADR